MEIIMMKKALSFLAPAAISALSVVGFAAPVQGKIPCPQSFIDLLNNEVYGPQGALKRLAGDFIKTVDPINGCQLNIEVPESENSVLVHVTGVNPKIFYSMEASGLLGDFVSSGTIRINAGVKAHFQKESGACTGTFCDFTRNETAGDALAKEWMHIKLQTKMISDFDQPFKVAFTTYLQTSDFWSTVASFVNQELDSSAEPS